MSEIVMHDNATPMRLVEMAVSQNADVDKLEKLMQLQLRWSEQEARKAYLHAFARFQSIVPTIRKSKEGHGYKYAPLGDIAHQIRESLQECGLSYRFEIQDAGEVITVTCIVSHVDGHSERTSMTGAPDDSGRKSGIQSRASTVSYLQRYSLVGALGLTTADEDIDGRMMAGVITPEQAAAITARLDSTGSDISKFCRVLGISSIEAMPSTRFAQADKMLTQKEASNAAA